MTIHEYWHVCPRRFLTISKSFSSTHERRITHLARGQPCDVLPSLPVYKTYKGHEYINIVQNNLHTTLNIDLIASNVLYYIHYIIVQYNGINVLWVPILTNAHNAYNIIVITSVDCIRKQKTRQIHGI